MKSFSAVLLGLLAAQRAVAGDLISGIYYDQYHTQNIPGEKVTAGINQVFLAFVNPLNLNTDPPGDYKPFTTVASMKEKFGNTTQVMISVGGWGAIFNESAATEASRALFAKNVGKMLNDTGADGVDIDWEYPGGNGADYKIIPNSAKTSEIETFPLLLEAIRAVIGPNKLLTIAVPGLKRDMIAYTAKTVPRLAAVCDQFNLMTYDLMNRRDSTTKHHTGVQGSAETVDTYLSMGLPASKAVLGFAYYAKWFTTDPTSNCATQPIGCATVPMEDALGNDLGNSGAWTFEPQNMVVTPVPTNLTVTPDGSCGASTGYKCKEGDCCSQYGYCGNTPDYCGSSCLPGYGKCDGVSIANSWQSALVNGSADEVGGGQYYWDSSANIFWTWDTPEFIGKKFAEIVAAKKLAGVFGFSLGEDTYDNSHMLAVQKGVNELSAVPGYPSYRRHRYSGPRRPHSGY